MKERIVQAVRRMFCCNVDLIWGHLCQEGEGCQRHYPDTPNHDEDPAGRQNEIEAAIRADERAKIAAAIRSDIVRLDDGTLNPFGMGQEYAARIVEAGR